MNLHLRGWLRFSATIILFIFSLFAPILAQKTIIKGAIRHHNNRDISFIQPLHGNFFLSEYHHVSQDDKGNFVATLSIDTSGMVNFYCDNIFWRMFVEPHVQDSVYLDFQNPSATLQFFGKNAVHNQFLNSLQREKYFSNFPTATERKIAQNNDPKAVFHQISEMREAELTRYFAHQKNNVPTLSFQNIVSNDIWYYHTMLFNSIVLQNFKPDKMTRAELAHFKDVWGKYWATAMDSSAVSNDDAVGSYWYHDFMDKYIDWYRGAFKGEIRLDTLDIRKGDNILITEKLIRRYFKGKALEAALANILHDEAYQQQFQPVLMDIYQRFSDDFPHSAYHKHLAFALAPVMKYWQAQKNDLPENVKILDKYNEINTLEEALKPLRGKVVYIDIWATWCAPCKDEFAYKSGLDDFMLNRDITTLFISIDKPDLEGRWKEMMKFYKLSGSHLRANNNLIGDIRRIITGDSQGTIAIPRYLIIDKNGNIMVKEALRPSDGHNLYSQLAQYLF